MPTRVPNTVIRHAAPADASRIHSLLSRYFDEWSIQHRDTLETVLSIIYQEPVLGYFVAEHEGEILGCVLCYRMAHIQCAAEIKRLYVLPELRGHGLGKQLFAASEKAAQAAALKWLYLDSLHEFSAALKLYEKHGYQPCDRYNGNQQAALFFKKRLG
jgi:putative acetyltransferase